MEITVDKRGKRWYADLKDLPGSPPTGDGQNQSMAIACLFYRLIFGGHDLSGLQQGQLIVNGKKYVARKDDHR